MTQYIAYIWKYGDKTAMLSRDNEGLASFKHRVESCYPELEWHIQISEFND